MCHIDFYTCFFFRKTYFWRKVCVCFWNLFLLSRPFKPNHTRCFVLTLFDFFVNESLNSVFKLFMFKYSTHSILTLLIVGAHKHVWIIYYLLTVLNNLFKHPRRKYSFFVWNLRKTKHTYPNHQINYQLISKHCIVF